MSSSASRVWMTTGSPQPGGQRQLLGEHGALRVARARSRSGSRGQFRRPRAPAAAPSMAPGRGGRGLRRVLGVAGPPRGGARRSRTALGPVACDLPGLPQLRLVVGGQDRRARPSRRPPSPAPPPPRGRRRTPAPPDGSGCRSASGQFRESCDLVNCVLGYRRAFRRDALVHRDQDRRLRPQGWRPAPCRSTRCPSAWPASGWRRWRSCVPGRSAG